jgi:hypothetical protein
MYDYIAGAGRSETFSSVLTPLTIEFITVTVKREGVLSAK